MLIVIIAAKFSEPFLTRWILCHVCSREATSGTESVALPVRNATRGLRAGKTKRIVRRRRNAWPK
eukprot:4948383-Prymnesium_polylepis.1